MKLFALTRQIELFSRPGELLLLCYSARGVLVLLPPSPLTTLTVDHTWGHCRVNFKYSETDMTDNSWEYSQGHHNGPSTFTIPPIYQRETKYKGSPPPKHTRPVRTKPHVSCSSRPLILFLSCRTLAQGTNQTHHQAHQLWLIKWRPSCSAPEDEGKYSM